MSSAITVTINKKECDLCPDERSSGWLRCCLCERFQGNLNICKSAWKHHENVQFFQFAGFLSVLDMVMHMLWNLNNFNIYFKWTSFVVRNFCSFSQYFWCCFPNPECSFFPFQVIFWSCAKSNMDFYWWSHISGYLWQSADGGTGHILIVKQQITHKGSHYLWTWPSVFTVTSFCKLCWH